MPITDTSLHVERDKSGCGGDSSNLKGRRREGREGKERARTTSCMIHRDSKERLYL